MCIIYINYSYITQLPPGNDSDFSQENLGCSGDLIGGVLIYCI